MKLQTPLHSLLLISLLIGTFACTVVEADEETCGRASFQGSWQGEFITTAFRADSVTSEFSFSTQLNFESNGTVQLLTSFTGQAPYNWYVQSEPALLILQLDRTRVDSTDLANLAGADFVYEVDGCQNDTKTLVETRTAGPQDVNDRYVRTLIMTRE